MSNYVGVRCPVCHKKFSHSDDIVVCPDCGAPHHRECYAQLGECAFAADHISGKEWRPPEAEGPAPGGDPSSGSQEPKMRQCPRCSSANPEGAIFCQICGAALSAKGEQEPSSFYRMMQINPFGGVRGDETIAEIPVRDMAQYIGPNSAYYLPRFLAFDKAGRHIMPNLSAFFFSFYYCFYRKMYAVGAVLLAIYLMGITPLFLVAQEVGLETMLALVYGSASQVYGPQVGLYLNIFNVMGAVNTVLRIGFFLLANHLYYNHVIDKMQALARQQQPDGEYRQLLKTAGGVNQRGAMVLMGTIFCAMSFVFALMIA